MTVSVTMSVVMGAVPVIVVIGRFGRRLWFVISHHGTYDRRREE